MKQMEFKKVPYEKQEDLIIGYKILLHDQQVATLEFRNGEWIGAVFTEGHLLTLQKKYEDKVYEWIKLNVQ